MGIRIKIEVKCDFCGKKVDGTAKLDPGIPGSKAPMLCEYDIQDDLAWKTWNDPVLPNAGRLACPPCAEEHGPKSEG